MKVFVAEPFATIAMAKLRSNPRITLIENLEECEALLIRSQTVIDQKLLQRTPHLQFIATATSGFDHIQWRACADRKITACFTPEANAASTAELALFFILSMLRRPLEQMENVRKGQWRSGLTRGDSLAKKTLGLVGLGRVGSHLAKLANAFGMHIVAHDPYASPDAFATASAERLGLIELLRVADVVSLHVPLTRQTKHLINQATLGEMPRHCFLVNVSRGSVVDESEVLVALREQRLAGVGLDVLEREPPLARNELLRHPHALVTPHVGAYTTQAFEAASLAAVDRLFAYMDGKSVPDSLPLAVPWFDLNSTL